eukprot:gene6747-9244_t
MVDRFGERLQISLSALQLPRMKFTGSTDSFAVLYQVDAYKNEIILCGFTEVCKDNLSAVYETTITVDYHFHATQEYLVRIYSYTPDYPLENTNKHTLLGHINFTLTFLMRSDHQMIRITMDSINYRDAIVEVRAEQLNRSSDYLCAIFSANQLTKSGGFFHTASPYYTISRLNEGGSWSTILTSTHATKTINPVWQPMRIPMDFLCEMDIDRPLQVNIFDFDSHPHVPLGTVDLTVRSLLDNSGTMSEDLSKSEKIMNISILKNGKNEKGGELISKNTYIERNPTFPEFIAGGCEISLIVAVDFTSSNLVPTNPESLHYLDPDENIDNSYQQAIRTVCSVLENYDSDKMYPVYGFGAKFRSIGNELSPVQHCFPLTSANGYHNIDFQSGTGAVVEVAAEVHGVKGILDAYKDTVKQAIFSGPTLFAPIIKAASTLAAHSNCSQSNQKYSILLILTDGVVSDFENTKAAIVEASRQPLSIIIVGIGSENFDAMRKLDGDQKLLVANGKSALRDIVQFVSLADHKEPGVKTLAQDLLEEVPSQLLLYMKHNEIVPNRSARFGTL